MNDAAQSQKRRHWIILASLAFLVILSPFLWLSWQTLAYYRQIKSGALGSLEDRRLDASISTLVANADVTEADRERVIPSIGLYPELGGRNARVTLVEFVDYQCPFCQRTAPVVRRVMASMGDRVRFVIRDFPILELHPGAKQSALAARCVLAQGQEPYWRYHDLLLADVEHQTPADLRANAERVNIDMKAFDECVAQELYMTSIDGDIQTGLRAGVQGTPTFFVNGIKVQGALDEKTLTRLLNAVLEQLPK